METLKIFKSKVGKDILVYKHASLFYDKAGSGGNKIWKCSYFAKTKCAFRLHTSQVDGVPTVAKVLKEHNHVVTR
jgi:hypothetical protein